MFDALFIGMTFSTTGHVLLGVTVVLVHWRVVKEHKIDKKVITEMRRERNVAMAAIAFIILGYYVTLAAHGYVPLF